MTELSRRASTLAPAGAPAPLTPLVGRDAETAEVIARLRQHRLLTLTGPGGCGKTRLALAAATADPVRGVWVSLSSLTSSDQVVAAVGRGLDVRSGPERVDVDALALGVGEEELLLVLDTCEHLAEPVGDFVEQLLGRCPPLTVLATSRMPLGVPGERLWPVPPLATPDDPAEGRDGRWDAVELFWQRAHAVRPDLTVDASSAERVAAICRRLDGNPLAIELCAARAQVLGLAEIEAALDDAVGLLVSRSRSGPERQQTIQATLDWSHRLLTESQARLFRRLAVFRGGASFDSVAALAAEPPEVSPVLDVLSALVERSLVRLSTATPGARYELPDPVRQYAQRKLAESGEDAAVRAAHLRHFRRLATQASASIDQSADSALYARLETELPNLRAALDWSRLTGDPELELGFALDLAPFAIMRGHHREGRAWVDRALARADVMPGIDPRMRVRATRQAGVFAFLQCDYHAAVALLEACRIRFAELNDQAGVAAVVRTLAGIAREQGDYARAEELLTEALQIGYLLEDEISLGLTRTQLAFTALLRGDHRAAQADAADSLRTARRVGKESDVAGALIVLGGAHLAAHNLGAARGCLQEALARSEADQLSESIAYAQQGLAMVALGHASLPEAARLLASSLRRQYELGDRWRTASVLVTARHL